MIETRVDGSPGQVRAGAAWLQGLAARVRSSTDRVTSAARSADAAWEGEASTAYAGVVGAVDRAAELQAARLLRAAEAFAAYADLLQVVRDRAADVRARAAAGGLVVDGTLVLRPTAPPVPPAPVDAAPAEERQHEAAVAAHRARVGQLRLYEELAELAADLHEEHRRHVDERLRPLAAELADGPTAAERLRGWWPGEESFAAWSLASVLAYPGLAVKDRVRWLGEHGRAVTSEAARLRADARSGDPSRRAPARAPAAVDERRALARAAEEGAAQADRLRGLGRVLGPAGLLVEGIQDQRAIAEGASPSATVVATGGSVAGGWAGGAAVLALGGGPVGAALVAGALAMGGDKVAAAAWREVPPQLRDDVDEALVAVWDAGEGALETVSEVGGDLVDATGDLVADAADAVGDGWDDVVEVLR